MDATFEALGPLSELRHPTKSHLTAVRAFDVLPDQFLWGNQSGLVRFGEDPGEVKAGEVSHSCLSLRDFDANLATFIAATTGSRSENTSSKIQTSRIARRGAETGFVHACGRSRCAGVRATSFDREPRFCHRRQSTGPSHVLSRCDCADRNDL